MKNLIFVMGRSGVGKDTLVRNLLREKDLQLTNLVPYTTRPPRFEETNGVDYNFVDRSMFDAMKNSDMFLETRTYAVAASGGVPNEWSYATPMPDKNVVNAISITTPEAFTNIYKNIKTVKLLSSSVENNVILISLNANTHDLLMRAISREESHILKTPPNYNEVCRRFIADSRDFADIDTRIKHFNDVCNSYNYKEFEYKSVQTSNKKPSDIVREVTEYLIRIGIK